MKKNKYNIKKYLVMSFAFIIVLFTFALNVNATQVDEKKEDKEFLNTGIFDQTYSKGVYKFSDEKQNNYLPFFRYSLDRIIVDKEINNSGIMYATKALEVNEKINSFGILASSETVRINAPMEYAVILSAGNVIIDSTIEKTVIILASDTVTITENAKLNGDIICFSKNLDIKGTVNGSVIGTANKLDVTGKIKNDIRIQTNDITLSSKENVGNGIYIETYNKNLNIKENYPDAIINIVKEKNNTITSPVVILSGITSCLVFTLLFLLVKKITKNKMLTNLKERTAKFPVFTIISGAVSLLIMPVVVLILFMLSLVGLSVIAIPLLILYIVLIIVGSMLSLFIVGGTIFTYIREKYLKSGGMGTDILGVFCTFASLFVLTKLPVVGSYISIAISMLAIGMIITTLFKRSKMEQQIKKKD